jgi:adenosylcobinamide-GDP ribazoletransferase
MSGENRQGNGGTGWRGWIRDARVVLCFLTRLPVSWPADGGAVTLADASRAFPLVGLVVGGIAAIFWLVLTEVGMPAWPAALLTVGAGILMTGALHEDGLADVADGAGAGGDLARRLEIMRDSRIGTYGVVAVTLSIGLRVAALAAFVDPAVAAAALVAAHAGGRAVLPMVMAIVPHARRDGLSVDAGRPSRQSGWLALTGGAVIVLVFAGFAAGLAALAVSAIVVAAGVRWAKARLGGQTGDVLGALEQLAEIAILLTLTTMAP